VSLPNAPKEERKSVVRTTRLPESLALSLQKDAADEGTTVNAVINSIIRRYYEWDKKARESGFTMIQKPVLKALVEAADDEELLRIGRDIAPVWFEDMADYWFQDSSPDRILDTISRRFKFDPLMRTEITKDGNAYSIVLRHDLGPKWSIIAEAVARRLTKKFYGVEPVVTRGDSIVTARFKANPASRAHSA